MCGETSNLGPAKKAGVGGMLVTGQKWGQATGTKHQRGRQGLPKAPAPGIPQHCWLAGQTCVCMVCFTPLVAFSTTLLVSSNSWENL